MDENQSYLDFFEIGKQDKIINKHKNYWGNKTLEAIGKTKTIKYYLKNILVL